MSNWPACDASLAAAQKAGDPWGYCTQSHCDESVNYAHQLCYCTGMFHKPPFIQIVGGKEVCINDASTLIPMADKGCYCCCSCLAYDTPIAVTKDTEKMVQEFSVNDPVLVAENADLKSWVQKPVLFSSGTGANGQNKMIKISFGERKFGINVSPASFVSQFVNKKSAEKIYDILSDAQNNYIGSDGVVNLQVVMKSDRDVLADLLSVPVVVAQRIYETLRIDSNYLLVNGTQPFLMKDKTLKQAQKLVPGIDELVRADGSTTPIISIELGLFNKGVHHIATSKTPADSLDGHLIIANGIVVGDYATQISLNSKSGAINDVHENALVFGTNKYNALHSHLKTTPFSAHVESCGVHETASFDVHRAEKSAIIPKDAHSFITNAQADILLHDAPIYPASHNVAEPAVRYLFRLFGAYYPDIVFYYDRHNMVPNVYSFKQYGNKYVVVTFGWTLLKGIYFQGIAMAIAQLINALNQDTEPQSDIDLVANADYNVYPVILGLYFLPSDAVKNYNLGLEQIKTVFGYIDAKNENRRRISLDCRIKVFEASIKGLPLPHCAGGPPDPALELVSVSASHQQQSEMPVINVTFNMPVDPETSTCLGYYMLEPSTSVCSAKIDNNDHKTVCLIADIKPSIQYNMVIIGVLSKNMQPLICDKNEGKFVMDKQH